MGAIDRVAHILPGSDDGGGGQEKGDREVVVQPEDDVVCLDVTKFDQVLDSAEDAEHLDDQTRTGFRSCTRDVGSLSVHS